MDQVTVKTSTILVSVGRRTRIYRSVEDVPPPLRRKLTESTSGSNSATILIADRKGREELVRAIQGRPTNLRFRVNQSRLGGRSSRVAKLLGWMIHYQRWLEGAGVFLLAMVAWLIFLWR